ncbi:phosphatase PAP2 family protein [Ruegeria sp. ANG10]|uniref:phosphatase PAP2 family protein n=1 Tax=Ruegeria sp. ANG10 TaxID=3042467 RepID=UPI0034558539
MLKSAIAVVAFVAFAGPAISSQFYPANSLDSVALIGPPAEPGSVEFDKEMFTVLWLQESRTPEQVAFVQKSVDLDRFAPIVATGLLDVDTQVLGETLEQIIDEVRDDYNLVKANYDIPRPFVINDAVEPVATAFPVTSYPSGHTIRAIVYTSVLSDIFPEHSEQLEAFGREIGYGRVIGGVHYPMDVKSGQVLGDAYMDVIREQPAYQDALNAIRNEKSNEALPVTQ